MLPSSLRWRVSILLLLVSAAIVTRSTLAQGPLTIAPNLRVRTDANGYLIATGGAYTGPDGPLTNFGNIRLRTDANGYLITTIQGDQSVPTGVATGSVLASNGVGAAGVWSASPTLTTVTLGATPATSGDIRLPSAFTLQARNSANNANRSVLAYAGLVADTVELGNSTTNTDIYGALTRFVGNIALNSGVLVISGTAPTITSGFNTSPTITGTAFSFSVGTGTTASTNTAVIGLPTASAGWSCQGQDLSDGGYVNQVASAVGSASFKYYSRTTGLAINWPASVTISFLCGGR